MTPRLNKIMARARKLKVYLSFDVVQNSGGGPRTYSVCVQANNIPARLAPTNTQSPTEHTKQILMKTSIRTVTRAYRLAEEWLTAIERETENAIFAAEQVLDIFEKRFPEDKRPRKAIDAAKNAHK